MVDRDGKKTFTIPKTHVSTKDVLFSEKPDSRNVTELFHDMKSCALEVQFDFRQNECKSCDTIRNPKLQKLFNERRQQMKRSHEPVERFAFQIISSRDIALQIGTDGLTCEQAVPSIGKYLGKPTDGVHLSRRPDVLLASTGSRSLHTFGLLICKILLGKGYPTVPAANNIELPAQLHYDHHFCKIQTFTKEQRQINDLLASSLIFCYEHDDMQTLSHPSQILPLAILWYDLTNKFSSELIPTPKESQQRVAKPLQRINSVKTKRSLLPTPDNAPQPMNWGSLKKPAQDLSAQLTIQTTPPKYPNHCMIPYTSLYTPFSSLQPSPVSRDPRITRTTTVAETIPLSPLSTLVHKSSSFAKLFSGEKSIVQKDIPLAAAISLTDPRLSTLKQTYDVFYLESKTVKHAVQQQKRLNHYYDAKNGSTSKKTSYTPIPFVVCSISADEYERQNQITRNSSLKDYTSLHVSVVDCFHFGLTKPDKQSYIDLEENDNRVALNQMEVSDGLIEHEKQLNSQEKRLHLREQRQRKLQEHLDERKRLESAHSKVYIDNGRKLLKEHPTVSTSNNRISSEVLNFFSSEYRQENRPQVKRILAELLGVFIEKYGLESKQTVSNGSEGESRSNEFIQVPYLNLQTNDMVVDMDIESPSSQILSDHDERFATKSSTTAIEPISNPLITSQSLPEVSSHQAPDLTIKNIRSAPMAKCSRPADAPSSKQVARKTRVSSSEAPANNDVIGRSVSSSESTSNASQSRDEFVKLLTKEACISASSSPLVTFHDHSGSEDDEGTNVSTNTQLSSTRTVTLVSSDYRNNLIIQATHVAQEAEEPTTKRAKVDLVSPAIDDTNPRQVITDDRDYRQDYDERSTIENRHDNAFHSRSKSTSSRKPSRWDCKTRSPSTANRKASAATHFAPQQQLESHNHDQQRLFERPIHYQQQNVNYTTPPTAQSSQHQRFNYNHQSVAEHPHFASVNAIPPLMDTFNRGLVQISNNCDYQKPLPMANVNRNCLPSNQQYYQDTYSSNLLHHPPPLMSAVPTMNFTHSFDSKPSNTIEQLQMLLQDRSAALHNVQPLSQADYLPPSHMIHAHHDTNNTQRFSHVNTNTFKQNHPTFSYTDAEQLLTFVQHFRH